jgi:hypothetical protein
MFLTKKSRFPHNALGLQTTSLRVSRTVRASGAFWASRVSKASEGLADQPAAQARLQPHRVLRISRNETDPVQIILAAHVQLRRWRRSELGEPALRSRRRIHEILAARDALVMRVARRNAIPPR